MLETIVIILIIALAAGYVARNFYRKFGVGKPQNGSSGCTGCGCSSLDGCDPGAAGSNPPENCPGKDST